MGALDPKLLAQALTDPHPGVRRHAVRLCEGRFNDIPGAGGLLARLVDDPDANVRLQLACSLGAWDDPAAGALLGRLALKDAGDAYLSAGVFSSVSEKNLVTVMRTVMDAGRPGGAAPPPAVIDKLLTVASATGDAPAMAVLLGAVGKPSNGDYDTWQLAAVAQFLDALDRRGTSTEKLAARGDANLAASIAALSGMFKTARAAATDANAPAERRAAAVRLLARQGSAVPTDVEILRALLVPQVPEEVQSAAVAALSRGAGADAPALLLSGWKGYAPGLRARVLDVLLARGDGLRATLDALEAKKVLPADIDAERRQRILQNADGAVRERAAKLLADVVNPDRQKVLAAYAEAMSLEGDPARGQAHFTKLCATCHQLNKVGNNVGPDLTALTDKSPEFLLTSIIDPNRAVEARYANYVADTKSGETLSGVLASETGNSVTLLGADGKSHVLLRGDLKSLRGTGTSLMPEGLETGLAPSDLADLIAFVRGATPQAARKTFAGNKPEVVRPGPDGSLRLLPTNGEIYGKTLVLEDKYGNLGYWSSEDDHVVWVVEPARPGRYNVWIEFACEDSVANNRFVLQSGAERMKRSVPGTGNWDTYKRHNFGQVSLRLGRQRVTIRTEGPVAGALMDLKSVELVPVR
jgi:putative heme-binding domain-containing protein